MSGSAKAALRQEVLERRDALDAAQHRERSAAVLDNLRGLSAFQQTEIALMFASFGSEVNTWPLLEELASGPKKLVLPAVGQQRGRLHLRVVEDLDAELEPGPWGIQEPEEGCPEVEPGELDFLCVPGVAFQHNGARLGYGGGYYDRLLTRAAQSEHPPAVVAIAFELQIVPHVPMGEHDWPVPVIVTEERIIRPAED